MPELVIKSAIQNGDLPKPKTFEDSVLKPLEDILNKHYIEKVMNKHGDIMKVFPKK